MFGIFLLSSLECALEFLLWFTVCAFSWFGKMFLNNNNFFIPFHLETHAKLESINSSFNSPGMKPYRMWSFKWQLVNSTLLWAKISKTKLRQALLWQYILYIMTFQKFSCTSFTQLRAVESQFLFCFLRNKTVLFWLQEWAACIYTAVILSECTICDTIYLS